MADIDQLPGCCGITELMYIQDDDGPEQTLMSFDWFDLSAHAIFSVTSSDTPRHLKGHKLAGLIKENDLGRLISTPAKRNPGHKGTLKAWVWTPNKAKFKAWQEKVRLDNPGKYYSDPYYNQYNPRLR